MRYEDRLLFLLARQHLQAAQRDLLLEQIRKRAARWELVAETALQHGVAPLLYKNLQELPRDELGVPPAVFEKLRTNAYRHAIEREKASQRLDRALDFLNQRAIDTMLIKGCALDLLVYDHPWYTASKDYDLIFRKKREEFSQAEIQEIDRFFHQSGIEYDYYQHHDANINGALPVDFERVWRDAQRIELHSRPAFVMSAEDMLISLCINSCRKRFFRLKSLCDISEAILRFPELDWEVLVEKADAYDCSNIVYTALLITDRTLGCPPGRQALSRLKVPPLRAAVLRGLVGLMLEATNLASYPYSGVMIFGRQIHVSLLLPYAAYKGYQRRHKIEEISAAHRLQDSWED